MGNNILIQEYSITLTGHSVTYQIDPLLIPSTKSFEITDFSDLPGLDSGLLPLEVASGVMSLSAPYTSRTYPAIGSSKLVIGSM